MIVFMALIQPMMLLICCVVRWIYTINDINAFVNGKSQWLPQCDSPATQDEIVPLGL